MSAFSETAPVVSRRVCGAMIEIIGDRLGVRVGRSAHGQASLMKSMRAGEEVFERRMRRGLQRPQPVQRFQRPSSQVFSKNSRARCASSYDHFLVRPFARGKQHEFRNNVAELEVPY